MSVSPRHLARAEMRQRCRGLYGIAGPVSGATPEERRRETLALADALLAGGAPVVQLRDKLSDGRALLETARELRRRTRVAEALFIVNDRLDIALLAQADGVHVGQEDLPPGDARRVALALGREDFLIGFSTHDLDQVREAATLDVDLIGFGPVFATTTKVDALPQRGIALLAEAVRLFPDRPVVGIGGIGLATAPSVAQTGVPMAAVIGDLVHAADRVQRVKDLHAILLRSHG
jgi:thiamine-phosphate pyrophosphorylase